MTFEDIFKKSNSSKEKSSKPTIIIDIHEKNSLVPSELFYSKEIITKICHLKIGDYLTNNVYVERKTTNDFLSSFLSKRLDNQIEKLKTKKKKLIILEKSKKPFKTRINPNIIRGKILSIILKHKIPIIKTKDSFDTAKYLILLSKKDLKI